MGISGDSVFEGLVIRIEVPVPLFLPRVLLPSGLQNIWWQRGIAVEVSPVVLLKPRPFLPFFAGVVSSQSSAFTAHGELLYIG